MARQSDAERILVIIGAIVSIIYAILNLVGIFRGEGFPLDNIVFAIIVIVVSLLLLSAEGVFAHRRSISLHWLVVLIIGILFAVLFGALWGGIILIIAAIVGIFT